MGREKEVRREAESAEDAEEEGWLFLGGPTEESSAPS